MPCPHEANLALETAEWTGAKSLQRILEESGATIAAANNAAIPGGVILISPSATSPALSTIDDKDLFFRTAPSDARQGVVMTEIIMDRSMFERRIFPCIDISQSGTRKEEKLIPEDDLEKVWMLRRVLSKMKPVEAMELLLERLGSSPTNKEFLEAMSQG